MATISPAKLKISDRPVVNYGPAVVTFVLLTVSLGFAIVMTLFAWPDDNLPLSLMIPVLIGIFRASPTGMRVIVALVVGVDVAMTLQTHASSVSMAITLSTLVAVCILALRVHTQRGEILGLQRVATDRADRAERREQQLIDFIDLVYHDVRLPLEVARLQLTVLRQHLADETPQWAQARTTDADAALGQMSAMLKNLFDIGRQEAGRLPLQRVPIDVQGFVVAQLKGLSRVLDVERVVVEIPEGIVVEADQYQVQRIVSNLVANALKYSADGTPVTVRAAEEADGVVLSVLDRGIGIAADELPHVFERGYRTAEARHCADGAGLGLYTVCLFVEAHSGHIWVESTPGQGSAFYVMLPRT
jgi:signal transduction histidine kinase